MSTSWERVAGPTSPPAHTDTVLYTVPAGFKLVVRQVSIVNTSTTLAEDARLYIGAAANNHFMAWRAAVPANSDVQLTDLRTVLYAGEALHGYAQGASITFTVNGFLVPV